MGFECTAQDIKQDNGFLFRWNCRGRVFGDVDVGFIETVFETLILSRIYKVAFNVIFIEQDGWPLMV